MARSAAFFDLDRTLLTCNSGRLLLQRLHHQGHVSLRFRLRALGWLFRYQLGFLDLQATAQRAVTIMRGHSADGFTDFCGLLAADELLPRIRPRARERLARHREDGAFVAILSSSPPHIVAPIAQALAIETIGCTELEVDASGNSTGRLHGPACFGDGKLERAVALARAHDLDLAQSYFYTDSFADLPMLERIGHPVAVNPDPRLRRAARARGIPIEDWS